VVLFYKGSYFLIIKNSFYFVIKQVLVVVNI